MEISGILLVAGMPTRMGQPKQLLPFGLQHDHRDGDHQSLLDSQLVEVVAVLVHQRHRIYLQIELKLTEHRLRTVDNPDYFHNLKRLGS